MPTAIKDYSALFAVVVPLEFQGNLWEGNSPRNAFGKVTIGIKGRFEKRQPRKTRKAST
jgi:hypothetical protein